jgi:glycosyltransferase involved in cell wall biosynthesis
MIARREPDARASRVLHVVPALFDPAHGILGGAERYALELARHMSHQVPTTLVSFGPVEREETAGSLRIRVIGDPHYVRGQRTNPIARALVREILKADVVHCHQQRVVAASVSAVVGRATGRRVFVTELGGGGWDVSTYVSTDGWFSGHLHISDYSREVHRHADRASAHVILGGVDTTIFSPPDPSVPSRREREVLFVGRLLPHKGVDDLIRAMPAELPLTIIGQAYDASYLERLRGLASGKRVTFRHDVDDDGLVHAYRRARCVVLPSVYRTDEGLHSKVPELLGQTLLEGMACGSPVICTRVASMPEIVEDGVTGFVVPPNDPVALRERLVWLMNNPSEAERMGAAARRRVLERFTWPAVVDRCLAIYRS